MTLLTPVQAVNAVMVDVGAVGKDSKSKAGGNYAYRGIDDVINALAGPMRTHGLVLVPHVVDCEVVPMHGRQGWTETRMTVEYDVIGPDGTALPRPVRTFAIGADNGDKGPGKALSYAYKAAISQLFCIPTDDPAMDNEHAAIPEPVAVITPAQRAQVSGLFGQIEDAEARKRAKVDWANTLPAALESTPAVEFDAVYASAMDAVEAVTA